MTGYQIFTIVYAFFFLAGTLLIAFGTERSYKKSKRRRS